ncbi:MAG TPA: ABC transporter ATP-binding protein [Bryobacteraceae bacterium]|jgi:lipopolysaccharide transport system ATP-binding protein
MTQAAIRLEGIAKRYPIGEARYRTFRDTLSAAMRRGAAKEPAEIWALADVSLEIERGSTVGLIGPNGAGKSTLLKILSRITEPTHGHAEVRGRVGSLLEVGTGFHPELTGRENIYFNGALLGMKKSEITRHFDRIVEFAGTERFLETPVKHYSSGMYMRLAFAVAAHLETDILLVDEVLAVGDAAFQTKCLGKMNEASRNGRTVIFVSHDMTNVAVLCKSAVLLDQGTVQATGPTKLVIEKYLSRVGEGGREIRWDAESAPGDDTVRLVHVRALNESRDLGPAFLSQEVVLSVTYAVQQPARLNPVFVVKNAWGVTVFSTANYEDAEWGQWTHEPGQYHAQCSVPAHLLNAGTYTIDALVVKDTRHVLAQANHAVSIEMHDDGSGRNDYAGEWVGVVRPRCGWQTQRSESGIDDRASSAAAWSEAR